MVKLFPQTGIIIIYIFLYFFIYIQCTTFDSMTLTCYNNQRLEFKVAIKSSYSLQEELISIVLPNIRAYIFPY